MNKFYIQYIFILLSIFVYGSNKALASELALKKKTTSVTAYQHPTPEEIYEKSKHLLCTNPNETQQAIELMNDALIHLAYHATDDNGYSKCKTPFFFAIDTQKKTHEDNTDILRIILKVSDPNQYNNSVNKLWNPDSPNSFNTGFAKIVRVYDPNLVMIQQRYEKDSKEPQKYFYALVKRAHLSENTTIIVTVSANINDHNPSTKEYKNTIIESANLFKTDIDSEDDIRQGKLTKVFVNMTGYLVEKKSDHIYVTYVESIDGHSSA
ncbi:fam-a protein [Plasmodium vinckei lentum]|uniref:Fam-a protein n=1 Tax=Plasmodium vinckei lentum TaxID=138297 RepID=A0A6V7SLL1_PLAVN|nr:fam-a protein [Plasmodium vinckei lentum]